MKKEDLKGKEGKENGANEHMATSMGIGVGMCFGVSLGLSFGQLLFDNMSLGMSFGLPIGMLIGMFVGMAIDAAKAKQLNEGSYTITTITPNEENTAYSVVIINKLGVEKTVIVSKEEMETNLFKINNEVSLKVDGTLEQVVHKSEE